LRRGADHGKSTPCVRQVLNSGDLCIAANQMTFAQLIRNRGWECLYVCLDRQRAEVEFAVRDVLGGIVDPNLDNSAPAAGSQIIRRNTVPLVEVLQERRVPSVIDYLSIDVEGAEERVLDSFDFDRLPG
jgi:hypothetical protein